MYNLLETVVSPDYCMLHTITSTVLCTMYSSLVIVVSIDYCQLYIITGTISKYSSLITVRNIACYILPPVQYWVLHTVHL